MPASKAKVLETPSKLNVLLNVLYFCVAFGVYPSVSIQPSIFPVSSVFPSLKLGETVRQGARPLPVGGRLPLLLAHLTYVRTLYPRRPA